MEHYDMENGTAERGCVLKIDNKEIAVSEAVYRAYWQEREREKYLARKALEQELSWQALEDAGMPVEVHTTMNAEEAGRYAPLYEAMAMLDAQMQEALWALACGETSERKLARELGMSKTTFHDAKMRALKALRAQLETVGYGR